MAALYDKNKGYMPRDHNYAVHLTELFSLTGPLLWTSETLGTKAFGLFFCGDNRVWDQQSNSRVRRVLPVRVSKDY